MPQELLNQIAELLGLSAEELAETTLEDIESLLAAKFEEEAAADEPSLETLEAITDATEAVRAEAVSAEAAEAERIAKIEALRERVALKAETPGEEVKPEGDDDDEKGDDDEPEETEGASAPESRDGGEPVAAEAEKETLVPVAASPRINIPRRRPQSHAPVPVPSGPRQLSAVVAAGDVPGYSAGMPIPTWKDLGHAFADKAEMLDPGQGAKVARMRWEYPADRSLAASAEENSERLANVIAAPVITAAGGLCAPVTPSYEQEILAVATRPVRDALPRFGASRGGVIHVPPPVISELANAVDIITAAEDEAGTTKPCLTITCADPETVNIYAVPACVQVGNFDRRTFPEHFEAFWSLASAQHAREAEGALLDGIATGSTNVSDGQNLGAARDVIEALIRARAQFISRHRMAISSMFRVLAPFWLRDLMRADLVREMPGAPQDRLTIADAQIDAMFRAAGYAPAWYLDTATGEGEVYAAQGAGHLLGWQTTPKLYIFPEGTWVFLDGGTLDFGVEIRDSTLNTNNNVRAMFETFENVVRMGPESIELELSLCISGHAGSLVDVGCPQVS